MLELWVPGYARGIARIVALKLRPPAPKALVALVAIIAILLLHPVARLHDLGSGS